MNITRKTEVKHSTTVCCWNDDGDKDEDKSDINVMGMKLA